MELSKHVVSLELARKLKELEVKQESLFYWVITSTTNYHLSYVEGDKSLLPQKRNDFYSAFTVAELGEMLPRINFRDGRTYKLVTSKEIRNDNEEWSVRYECETHKGFYQQVADTEADARANMLIYLVENKFVTL
jgi:hypothetical protein